MWASYWAGNYVVGEMTVPAVRKVVRGELFNSSAGRTYWAAIRENVLSTNVGKYRRFAGVVDEEYQKVMAGNVPVADPVRITDRIDNSAPPRKWEPQQLVALVGAALIAGILTGRKFSQWAHSTR